MMQNETVRPLHDVWLRPRRVMRALVERPSSVVDYCLGAAQGAAGLLYLSRYENLGQNGSLALIVAKSIAVGALIGAANLYVLAVIYSRLSRRMGAALTPQQTMHVLAYGSVPIATMVAPWLLTAWVAGSTTFMATPPKDTDTLIVGLLQIVLIAHFLMSLWSLLLQVMGFSELLGLKLPKALFIWLIGQLISLPAAMLIVLLIQALLPGAMPA